MTYGTQTYAQAIAKTVQIARDLAHEIDAVPNLELLLGPQLTVVLLKATKMNGTGLAKWCEIQRRAIMFTNQMARRRGATLVQREP